MITELVFTALFLVPKSIFFLFPSIPSFSFVSSSGFAGILELFSIGNQFFPLGQLFSYLSVWVALNVISLFKSFIDWVLSVIPLY